MTKNNVTEHSFEIGTILHNINLNKYTGEVKESFIFEGKDSKEKFTIKKDRLLEIANQFKDSNEVKILLNNGWKANEKMSAGTGKALKIVINGDYYECIFYIGKAGESFDTKKVERKTHIKFNKDHLSAIFTFLKFNEEVETEKAEEQKVKRTTLELD